MENVGETVQVVQDGVTVARSVFRASSEAQAETGHGCDLSARGCLEQLRGVGAGQSGAMREIGTKPPQRLCAVDKWHSRRDETYLA